MGVNGSGGSGELDMMDLMVKSDAKKSIDMDVYVVCGL
jgi:hypothetical protein